MAASAIYGQIFETPPVPNVDLTGRTIGVTGANAGLGFDACKHLLRLNVSHLILACHSAAKAEAARERLLKHMSDEKRQVISYWNLDMASYASVLAFADRCQTLDRLDSVLLNAAMKPRDFTISEKDETQITVNVVSTFLLAVAVLPKLRLTFKKTGIPPVISITGSSAHLHAKTSLLSKPAEGTMFTSLSDERAAATYHPMGRYQITKLLVELCCRALAEDIIATSSTALPSIIVNDLNPGWCLTEMGKNSGSWADRAAAFLMCRSCEAGSRTLVHGVTAGREIHGKYLSESKVKQANPWLGTTEGKRVQKGVWKELLAKSEAIGPGVTAAVES